VGVNSNCMSTCNLHTYYRQDKFQFGIVQLRTMYMEMKRLLLNKWKYYEAKNNLLLNWRGKRNSEIL